MDPLVHERLLKIEKMRAAGIEPFATKYAKNAISTDVAQKAPRNIDEILKHPATEIAIAGRLMTFREHGKICFGQLQDEMGRAQICFQRGYTTIAGLKNDDEKEHERFYKKWIDLGDFFGVSGEVFLTRHGEPTILVREITFLSKAIRPLPEKFHGLSDREQCYRERNLDLVSNSETMRRFQLRSKVLREIRDFFHEKSFDEIETRTLQPQAGGAMAKTFETHHNALDHDFVLRIALELDLKTAMGGGCERIFEIGKCFRNEGSDPSHLQEFTMIEWYAAFEDLQKNKEWTEELIRRLVKKGDSKMKMKILGHDEKLHAVDFSKPFSEERFPDLLKKYAEIDMFSISDNELKKAAQKRGVEETDTKGRATLLDDIYKKTARPQIITPTFVFDYPAELKPLARPRGDGTAECFQLLIGGWEVVNSYGELVDPTVQRALFEKQSAAKAAGDEEAMEIDEAFLRAMEHGFPPMTGSGIGIDRLLAVITAQSNLRDVVLFPTLKPEKKSLSARALEKKYRSKKVVVIADSKVDRGIAANAIGQLGISIGGHSTENLFDARIVHDAEKRAHFTDCFYGMSNLAGNQKQMAQFVQKCYDANIQVFDFTDVMRSAHTDEQMRAGYASKKTADLGYIAVGALVPKEFETAFLAGLPLFS